MANANLSLIEERHQGQELESSISAPRVLAWGSIVVLLSLASARAWLGLGRDYLEYVDYYNRISPFFSFQDTRFEPGFHLLGWVFSNVFGLPFWTFVFTIVFFALSIKAYLFVRYLKYPIVGMVVYLATFYPNQEYTQIRAAAAISLGMMAIHLFLERKYSLAILSFVIAFFFHYSIVLMVVAFAGSYAVKRNFLSLVLVVISTSIFVAAILFKNGLDSIIVGAFSSFNPLVGSYVDNIAAIDETSILSVNNLIVIAIFISAASSGWLSNSLYQKCFTIMLGLSVIFVVILSQAPIIAVRAKEMLLVSVIFASFYKTFDKRDIIPLTFVIANATLLLFLAIREGVILSYT